MAMQHFKVPKKLTYSDIISKLELPTVIVDHMNRFMKGKHFLDLKAADIWGQEWPLRYYTRPKGNREGPVFTTGWRKFVEAKRLQVGDEFIFYGNQVRVDDGEVKMVYMIEVKRPGPVTFQNEPVTLDAEYACA
ncbi:hypothetical protein Dsin_023864 [Dipteronia sinensis]|uniref:TF-B3 domain-containing protein n=1 Tax=Dipteronia sinensis TaxID=43782 RepID=A0AAE0A4E0_9ROSI|nr:hypothetical protein Dsin_023864 [Dipteronia sinensis]